jgi:thiamine pyrophosphate-dependent acetolactate synthase large subunit-like protein
MGEVGYCLMQEEIARGCMSTATFIGAHQSIGSNAIYIGGTEEQKKKYLPDTHDRKRFEETKKKHEAIRAKWAKEAQQNWDASPITLPRLASEVWEVIKNEDWVLTAGTLEDWTHKLWDFDKHYRHPGKSMGTATQIGISIGVALAHRDKGRLVVDMQPDGDLMYDAGALWVAAKHKIPMLVVMYMENIASERKLAEQLNVNLRYMWFTKTDLDSPAPEHSTFSVLRSRLGDELFKQIFDVKIQYIINCCFCS